MAFATNTLVNGEWTTRTVDVDAVLRHYNEQDEGASSSGVEVQKPPVLGVLAQTAIRSPLVNLIIPCKLRGSKTNDIAFIGDDFVQIKELGLDGNLRDIIQKDNFGARIRSACSVGSLDIYDQEYYAFRKAQEDNLELDTSLTKDEHRRMWEATVLAPQCLLIQLDSGDSVFLALRKRPTGGWELVATRHRVSRAMLMMQPGKHLVVNPSARYVAVGCSEGMFALYALNSREDLQRQENEGNWTLRYVKSERYIYLHGIIHKMDFLYPSRNDPNHIILVLLLAGKGSTRLQVYEWETDGDMRSLRPHSRRGHLLEESHQLPLHIVPLTIESSLMFVSEDSLAICKDILLGSPNFIFFDLIEARPTPIHHGLGPPLWAAWARPFRHSEYMRKHDDIYLVREDGLVKFLHFNESEEDIIELDTNIGLLASNCGTAMACLDFCPIGADTGDMLVIGGDSCVGSTYVIAARVELEWRQPIANWSPAQDIVTTSRSQDRDIEELGAPHLSRGGFPTPDSIYVCAGKGVNGSIAELRYGLEARLGLEMEFPMPIMDVWVPPIELQKEGKDEETLFLLSLVNRSALLRLYSKATEIDELDQSSTFLDLRHRTITATFHEDCHVQVTEQSVVFIHDNKRRIFESEELLRIYHDNVFVGSASRIDDAVTHGRVVLFATHFQYETYLQVLDGRMPSAAINTASSSGLESEVVVRTLRKYSPNVTCLAICSVNETLCAIVAEWGGASVGLTFHTLDGVASRTLKIPANYARNHVPLEAVVSISASPGAPGYLVLVCGTRNGLAVTLCICERNLTIDKYWCTRIGATPVIIKKDETAGSKAVLFVTCDSKLYTLRVPTAPETGLEEDILTDGRVINRVWLTDAAHPEAPQIEANSIARLLPNALDQTNSDVILISGSQLLLANLSTQPRAVPRHFPIGGTPSRLLYSHTLKCLIVAASVGDRCTLLFIDPENGNNLSRPVDKRGNPLKFASGLGGYDERVFRLLEWSYMKDGKTWNFIVVCTNTGRLLILSTEKETIPTLPPGARGSEHSSASDEEEESSSKETKAFPGIRYWTRYKFKCPKPVYSVAGFPEGLFYCSGNTVYCDVLNLAEKKFETVAQYDLPSPAIDLVHENCKIYATTVNHSLEVLELVTENGRRTRLIHTHGDQVARNTLHHRVLGSSPGSLLNLVSDRAGAVAGLWSTRNSRADTLEPVFIAQLTHSIVRFRAGRTRPVWDPTWDLPATTKTANHDIARNSADYPEVLGLSINGSLYHFTVLDFPSWKFLRFLVNLAMQSPKICEYTYTLGTLPLEPVTEPKTMMHVDGDILRRIKESDMPELLRVGEDSEEAANIRRVFCEVLRGVYGGVVSEKNMTVLVARAYQILKFFLRPVV